MALELDDSASKLTTLGTSVVLADEARGSSPSVAGAIGSSLTTGAALPKEMEASNAREASGSNDPSLIQANMLATSRRAPIHVSLE
eukprot:4243309-Amphidinium_carterae.1